ncbi:MAG: tetratricopeptide repeat protein [Candidatus Sericytochromatia bacterium]
MPVLPLFQQAQQAAQAGAWAEAEALFQRQLDQTPQHLDSLRGLGLICAQQKRYREAENYLRQSLAQAEHGPTQINLGEVLRRQGALKEALLLFQTGLSHSPQQTEGWSNLALTQRALGDPAGAIQSLERLLQLQPNHFAALRQLAHLKHGQGQFEHAKNLYRHCLKLRPTQLELYLEYADCLSEGQSLGSALDVLAAGLRQLGEAPVLLIRMAEYFTRLKEVTLAQEHFTRALRADPESLTAWHGKAVLHERQGEIKAARLAYANIQKQQPQNDLLRLHTELLAPPMLSDSADVDRQEAAWHACLDRWLESGLRYHPAELAFFTGQANFMHTYQTRGSGRALREKYVRLFRPHLPAGEALPPEGCPHIGFLVTAGHEAIFAKSVAGLLNHLPRKNRRYTVFCERAGYEHQILPLLTGSDIAWQPLERNPYRAAEQVRAARCDVLNFWEIATDMQNFILSFFRLAPVQTLSWGWPMTSGNPTVDVYLSAIHLESDNAPSHYTEQLHCFPVLPTYYYRPRVPPRLLSRRELGLPESARLYLCSQSLLKLHPDFDSVFQQILAEDPQAHILLLADPLLGITHALQARLARTCAPFADRIDFVPRRPFADYLSLVACCNLQLDPFHYAGANTSYDAFSVGTPVITLPSPYHKGRYTYAAYQEMGLEAGIAQNAQDYVSRVHHLGQDREARQAFSEQIAQRRDVLYENPEIVSAYSAFFDQALAQHGRLI